jgi:TolA-binding protein
MLSQPETSPDVAVHVRDCPSCAQLAAELRAVVSATAELPPVAPMSQASLQRIRHTLSVSMDESTLSSHRQRRPRMAWAFTGGLAGVALALCVWLYARPHAMSQVGQDPILSGQALGEQPSLARIRAFGSARFRRMSVPPNETVGVESGRVAFEVTHLAPGQRFRVLTGDGEAEVRGTRFEVEARDGALWAVTVSDGKVDVRVGGRTLRLQTGDAWERERPSSAAGKQGLAAPAGSLVSSRAATTEIPGGSPSRGAQEHVVASLAQPAESKSTAESGRRQSFDLAWSYLRRGQWDEAIRSFAAVAEQTHGQGLEEDARYWQAVATARSARSSEAIHLFATFLQTFPSGVRAGAATLALAWLRLDAGEVDQARILFERAALDPSAKVREDAAEGLRRLHLR